MVVFPFGKGLLPKVALPTGFLPTATVASVDLHPIVAHKVSQIV
jgi:hypothetical protein